MTSNAENVIVAPREGSILLRLERLHCTLLQLCSKISPHNDRIGDMGLSIQGISDTFDMLFKELNGWIACFMHESDVFSHNMLLRLSSTFQEDDLHSDTTWPSTRDIVLLLRCCLIIVRLLDFTHCDYTLDKCQVLVKTMLKLCCWNNLKLLSCKESSSYLCTSEDSDHTHGLRCSLIEVFVEELRLHQRSRELFRETNLSCSSNIKLFASHCGSSHNGALLEMVSAHFILSFDHDASFSKFRCSLFWSNEKDHDVPQLSLEAIMLLIRSMVICSTPYIFQAHFIMLASKVARVHFSPNSQKQNVVLLDKYISAFGVSVNLYRCLMTSLQLDVDLSEGNSCQRGFCFTQSCGLGFLFHGSFDSYIEPTTYEKIISRVIKLAEYSDCFPNSMLCKTKEEKITAAMDFFKENLHIIEEKFREETCLFLRSILSVFTSFESTNNVSSLKQSNWQEILCVAAFLNLMTNLLLQILLVFKDCGSIKNSKEYEVLSGIINSFVQSCQNDLVPIVRSDHLTVINSGNYDGIHLMLIHFVYMLLFSLHWGTEHLWKGYIVMILTLLNLLILRDGNLELFVYAEETFVSPPPSPFKATKKLQSCRGSSFVIASNFQKIQTLYLQKPTNLLLYGNTSMKPEEESEILTNNQEKERINSGKEYLKILGHKTKDVNDLADFIDCTEGKDYSVWLKNWDKFREWKHKEVTTSVRRKRIEKMSSLSKPENFHEYNTHMAKRARCWQQ